MTTATRTGRAAVPEHGGRSGYLRGCGCEPCRTAHYRYMSRWRLDNARGQRRRTSPAPARAHLQRLIDRGWLPTQIAQAADMNHHIVLDILAHRYPTISRRTAARILSVHIGPPPRPRDIDATGTIRRLRALVAIGHPISRIAPHVGLHRDALGVIARGDRALVRAETADRVADAYQRLSRTAGPSQRARNHATACGWPDPTFWEDYGGIDDPNAPETEPGGGEQPRYVALAEDGLWLERQGYTRAQAAERLGVTKSYLDHSIRRAERAQQEGVAA